MLEQIKKFFKDDEGAAAIEYALLVGLIALAIVVGATALGGSIDAAFDSASTKLDSAVAGPAAP
jgi:pilus assembly protein Flp/PilA